MSTLNTTPKLLTSYPSISLEHSFDLGFGALKRVEVPHKNSGVDCLRILRVGLVSHFAHLHFG